MQTEQEKHNLRLRYRNTAPLSAKHLIRTSKYIIELLKVAAGQV